MRKHEDSGVVRGSEVWKMLFDEFVMDRLQELDPPAFVRELRRRGLAPLTEEELGAATGGRGVVVPDGESTEGRRVRIPTLPYVPREKERREHIVIHYPHRTWCETCMSGRAVAGAHSRNKDESDPFAGEFHFDYCFLKNEVKDDPAVTLVGVDKATDAILAHVVPEKGTRFEWVATQLERDVRRFGYHGRLVVKSDGENAARELMSELAKKRRDLPTVVETSKPYDSTSNDRAGGAVRRLENQVRTLKIATEKNLWIVLDVHSPLCAWLVEHSADVLTKCAIGSNHTV